MPNYHSLNFLCIQLLIVAGRKDKLHLWHLARQRYPLWCQKLVVQLMSVLAYLIWSSDAVNQTIAEPFLFVGPQSPGPCLNIKTVFPGMGISIIKMRRSWDRVIFITGIPIPVRPCIHINTVPYSLHLRVIHGRVAKHQSFRTFNVHLFVVLCNEMLIPTIL